MRRSLYLYKNYFNVIPLIILFMYCSVPFCTIVLFGGHFNLIIYFESIFFVSSSNFWLNVKIEEEEGKESQS